MTLSATHKNQLQNIQESAKFKEGKAVPFPGYSVITPPWQDDSENDSFYQILETCQKQLLEKLNSEWICAVPASSFHVTVADLIWDSSYRAAIKENPQFEAQLRERMQDSFNQYQELVSQKSPIQFQLLGLTIFPRAIVVCLVPKDEASYEQIVKIRRAIYQNSDLIGLGIEQQYYFTAHITLGYFGEIPADIHLDHIMETLAILNDQWLEIDPQILTIEHIQLRKFDDMMSYYREENWPTISC
jgi:hypothetical protein